MVSASAPKLRAVAPFLRDADRRAASVSRSPSPVSYMLPRVHRLSDRHEVNRLFRNGKKVYGTLFSFVFLPSARPISRLGFIVGKKVYSRAVERNRAKRSMREAARPLLERISTPVDGLFVAMRRPPARLDFERVAVEMTSLLSRLRLLNPHKETPKRMPEK